MTNSLRKLAKDLKAFAKRCKDFKYTEKALFVFLLCGIAGFADVATTTDQAIQNKRQEISTSIGDIRQEFKKVKTENNKLVKNYNLELIQLMEQGDHVVKSPWSSWQYGMNYFYNDWTGTYKGRGDKTPNVKYKRNSEDKFGTYTGGKYGNTTLNKKVIEPISAVPVDAAVKPKIPTIKTVGSAEAPTIVTPSLNIQVSAVNPSSTTVPSITPPNVMIPGVNMKSVKGFTLVFPNSADFSTRHNTNSSYDVTVNNSTKAVAGSSPVEYISYHQFAGNANPVSRLGGGPSTTSLAMTSNTTITMKGSAEANNTYGSNQFYGGGSRFAYIDDVRNHYNGLTFTLKNEAIIGLTGPAIAGIVNEETSYTDGNVTTNITNLGSINDETELLTAGDTYTGTLRDDVDATSTTPLPVRVNNSGKTGYKVGITQTTEESVDHSKGTYYELFNGSASGSSTFFNDFDGKLKNAVSPSLSSIATTGKSTSINGNNFTQSGVIHFSGDYSTGIQVASVQRSGTGRSLLRADNKENGYIQLDGSHSYGMKLAGQHLYVDSTDYNAKTASYMANNGLILISGSYDTGITSGFTNDGSSASQSYGSSAGIAKLAEAKWNSEKTIFNNGRIYVGGYNNSGILLESIYNDTVTNNGTITVDKAYNLFNNPNNTVNYSNAVATSNAGIRIQSFATTDAATGNLVGVNKRIINLNNGSGNVGIYALDVENTNDIMGMNHYEILGENTATGTINVAGTNVGMMAQDDSTKNANN